MSDQEYRLEDQEGEFLIVIDGITMESFQDRDSALTVLNSLNNCTHETEEKFHVEYNGNNEIKVTCEYCGKVAYSPLPIDLEWRHE